MPHRALAFLCFFLSGATGLMYEVVWTRLLGSTIGNTHFSITVVVSVFMGGLALGSYFGGRLADRSPNPLRLYGLCVLLTGVACFLVPVSVLAARPFFGWLYSSYDGRPEAPPLLVARIAFAAVVLLLPTSFMGATLPALSRHLARRLSDVGGTIGRLYAINTLGAVVGVAFTGFIGIRALGVWGCTIGAVIIDVLIGAAVIVAARGAPDGGGQESMADVVEDTARDPDATVSLPVRLSLLAFGLTGFANMLLQIAWTKAIVLSIGNSTYAFSLIVTLFILGIAVGGGAASLFVDRLRNLPALLGALVTATAALVSLTIPFLGHFPIVASRAFDAVPEPSYSRFLAINIQWVAAMILPATVLMGTVFPIVGKIRARAIETVGSAVGSAYFWNTTGSILGTLAAGFLFIPLLGEVYWTLYIGAAINLATGLMLLAVSLDRQAFPVKGVAVALAAGAAIVLPHLGFLPYGVHGSEQHYWHPSIMSRGAYVYFDGTYLNARGEVIPEETLIRDLIANNTVLYYKEGIHAPVAVVRSAKGEVAMRISGKVEASYLPGGDFNSDQPHQILAGHLPMILHRRPKDVLTLGLGGGVTLGTLSVYPVESIDSLEISPEVIAAAREYFGKANRDSLVNPRVRNVVGDGRNHLEYTPKRFDVITSVPSNPWIAGIGNLFTVEFFRCCRERLTPGGVLCNWIHKINMRADDFRTVVRTFVEAFGDTAQLWDLGFDALLIGGTDAVHFDPQRFAEVLGNPEIAKDLAVLGITSAETLLRHYHFDAAALRRYCGEGPRNTDTLPVLEFDCPYGLYGHPFDAFESLALAEHAPLPPAWTGSNDAGALGGFSRTRDAFHRFQLAWIRYQRLVRDSALVHLETLDAESKRQLFQQGMEIIADLKAIERDTAGGDLWLRAQANTLAAQAIGVAQAQPTLEATLAMGLASYAGQKGRSREERAGFLAQAAPYARDNQRCVLEVAQLALELNPALGIPVVQAALAKSPQDARLLLSLGALFGASRQLDPALRTLEAALAQAKEPALRGEIHQNLALAYEGLGRRDEAIREYEKAIEQNPGSALARTRLEQLRQSRQDN